MTTAQAFDLALQNHQSGKLVEAEALYRQILAAQPDHADALHLMGVIALQSGRHVSGADSIKKAIVLAPNVPAFHFNLGEAYRMLGHLDEAVASLRNAIALKPDYAEAQNSLGIALKESGRTDEAIVAYRQAVTSKPDFAEAHNNLGATLTSLRMFKEAVAEYKRALELRPEYVDAYYNLGITLHKFNRYDEAIIAFQRALKLKPNLLEAQNHLGAVSKEKGDLEKAADLITGVLRIRPDYAQALENLGLIRAELGNVGDGLALFDKAFALKPFDHNIRCNYAILLLLSGNFDKGLPLYESRWCQTPTGERAFPQPRWEGNAVQGKRLLVYAEQGFGDSIQFVRYIHLLVERGVKVILECQPPLIALFQNLQDVDKIVAAGDSLPPFDLQIPMLSLPLALKTTTESIPWEGPYLSVESSLSEVWAKRILSNDGRPKIGIAWAGNPDHRGTQKRDLPLSSLLPTLRLYGIDFLSVQVGAVSEKIQDYSGLEISDQISQVKNFADTAALITQLDLVISVDTAVAHLAGALGKPVWTLLPFVPDWRWGLEGETTPWYPTMRLFRQPALGDWDSVIQRVAEELRKLAEAHAANQSRAPEA